MATYGELTADELRAIKLRVNAATPGPWRSIVEGRDQDSGESFIMTGGDDIYLRGASVADQDFIAHAREDVIRLLAEVDRLRAR